MDFPSGFRFPNDFPNGFPNTTACGNITRRPLTRFLCVQGALDGGIASTCLSRLPSIPLSDEGYCGPGFYCPNIDDNDPDTWPSYCPPAANCTVLRLEGQWCEPQGPYEPQLCLGGYFCASFETMEICPEGTFCLRGSTKPTPCALMSNCPAGSQTPAFYGGMLIAALIDAALIALYIYYRCFREPAIFNANAISRRRDLVRAADKLVPGVEAALAAAAAGAGVGAGLGAGASAGAAVAGELEMSAWGSYAASRARPAGAAAAVASNRAVNPLHSAMAATRGGDAASSIPAATASQSLPSPGVFASLGHALRAAWDALARSQANLPQGVALDSRGRVRTKSMHRFNSGGGSRGDGPIFSELEESSSATPGVPDVPKSRGDRVSRMITISEAAAMRASSSTSASVPGPAHARRRSSSGPTAAPADEPLDRLVASSATLVLEDGFRRCNASLRLGIDFEGLRLTLPPPLNKTILSGVSGRISPGRVTAVMGPSGAGKTTFLSVLMGKVARTAGTLRVNGLLEGMSAYRRVTGFVPQEDTMLPELSVRENIEHSARVRLPRHGGWDSVAVGRLVDAVIEVLGLRSCADTPTANVSGGQRKRTNIGMELAMAPAAIFLDEPTSGLDATAALEVCTTLRAIANLGLTVVAVVHQPRAEIFRSFDDLLLLAPGGKTVYMGPQAGVLSYFGGAGFVFGSHGNPADDLLDFIAGRDALPVLPADLLAAQAANEAADRALALAAASTEHDRLSGSWGQTFEASAAAAELKAAAAAAAAVGATTVSTPSAGALASRAGGKTPSVMAFPMSPSSNALADAAAAAASDCAGEPVVLQGAEVAAYLAARWRLTTSFGAGPAGGRSSVAGGGATDGGSGGSGGLFGGSGIDSSDIGLGSREASSQNLSTLAVPESGNGVGVNIGAGVGASPLEPGATAWQVFARKANDALVDANKHLEVLRRQAVLDANRALASLKEGQMPEAWLWAAGARGAAAGSPLAAMMADRGATPWEQFRLCHSRSLLQQYRQPAWLVLELTVCVAAGFIMGLAAFAVDELYSGVLRDPYTFLSPAPMETMLPSLGLYINIAIGVAGSPAAVRTFGEERDVFLREYSGGHSTLAYFAAKNVSVLYRLTLSALHFAGTFAFLARPTSNFGNTFVMVLGLFFGVYGLSTFMSMLVDRANAALLGTIASLVVACMCGFGPNLVQGREWGLIFVQDLSYSRWANELFVDSETRPYRSLYYVDSISAALFGYTLDRPGYDMAMMFALGLFLRLLALVALVLLARKAAADASAQGALDFLISVARFLIAIQRWA